MIICVYALVSPAPARLGLTGIAGERLRVITVNRIGAVVGELRRPPAASVRNLRRYAAVVESIAARVPAILPARFATTVAGREELTFILRSRRSTLRQRLRAVRSRAQMTVRVLESESSDAPSRSQTRVTSHARLRLEHGAIQGTQYLRQKVADVRAVPAFEPIRPAVGRYVKDERVEKRGGVVTINHLVPRTASGKYQAAIEAAAAENDVRLIVTGPWPPYAFADSW